jgi:uncharacterized protein (TIGR02145 family)
MNTQKNSIKLSFFIPGVLCIYLVLSVQSCTHNIPSTVTDIDGNVYRTVAIGSQVWMAENLKVTRYRNGDPIPNVVSKIQWSSMKSGAYCSYNNDSTTTNYGHLYNWYAATDERHIAPQGWHVASDKEFKTLTKFLGGESSAGSNLKESGTSHWHSPNPNAVNKYGFSALPSGYRNNYDGTFELLGLNGFWWSISKKDTLAWIRNMSFNDSGIFRNYMDKATGVSIRCVKD